MAESRAYRKLEAKIEEARNRQVAFIMDGSACDYATYRQSVGYNAALNDVLKLCELIEQEEAQ